MHDFLVLLLCLFFLSIWVYALYWNAKKIKATRATIDARIAAYLVKKGYANFIIRDPYLHEKLPQKLREPIFIGGSGSALPESKDKVVEINTESEPKVVWVTVIYGAGKFMDFYWSETL